MGKAPVTLAKSHHYGDPTVLVGQTKEKDFSTLDAQGTAKQQLATTWMLAIIL